MDAQKLMALGESADPSDCGLRVHSEKIIFSTHVNVSLMISV